MAEVLRRQDGTAVSGSEPDSPDSIPHFFNIRQHAVTVRDAVFKTQKTDRGKPSGELTETAPCPPRPGDLASVCGQAEQRFLPAKDSPQRRCERTWGMGMPQVYSPLSHNPTSGRDLNLYIYPLDFCPVLGCYVTRMKTNDQVTVYTCPAQADPFG